MANVLRVLVADDNTAVSDVLAALIRCEAGLDVLATVASADDAIALAESGAPDVAVVDVRMPGGGAYAMRGIKRVSPGTRIIAYSGTSDLLVQREVFAAGASDYVLKSSSPDKILAAIRRQDRERTTGPPS